MFPWSELSQLQWRFPGGALIALTPLLLGWVARRRQQQLARYAEPHLLPWAVQQRGPGIRYQPRRLAELTAWLLLAVAAAGPRLPAALPGDASAAADRSHVVDLMVALDVSPSMAATDVAPDRLTRARLELTDLLRRLHGERLGLLLYAGQAGLLLPLTEDHALFERALAQAGADLLEAPATDLARALTLARQALEAKTDVAAAGSRAVLLVTDAESSSLEGTTGAVVQEAVQALRAAGIPLFVLVVATEEGAQVPLATGGLAMHDGTPVISRPAVAAYRRLAQATGGDLALVRNGDADWDLLYDGALAHLPGAAVPTASVRSWREIYLWPLGLALLLLLWAELPLPRARLRALVPVLLLAVVMGGISAPSPAEAADGPAGRSAEAAAQAYRAGQWSEALSLFERQGGHAGFMGAGAAAWKLNDYATAAHHFSQALLLARTARERDDALYNLGNAHFGQGRWLSAAQAWRAVLLSRPGDARAAANLVHAEAQLARRAGSEPMKSDLRGHHGFTAEGLVGVDGAGNVQDESLVLPELPQGPQAMGEGDVGGARLDAPAARDEASVTALDPQRLQSGLAKLPRIEERRRELLRGLLKQDRAPAASPGTTGAPW